MEHITVDCHCDTIVTAFNNRQELYENKIHVDLKRLMKYKSHVQFFALWLDPVYYSVSMRQTMKYIDYYYKEISKNKNIISHVNSYKDIEKNIEQNKISSLLSIEGGEALEGEISALKIYYRLGVRAMTLTWNYRNQIADGAFENATGGGLTTFGKKVVSQMNSLGMIIDVSHLSDAGFWDVDKISEKPYIASHSNARKICNSQRNLTDEQIKAISKKGGAIGINLYPKFLSLNEKSDINDILKHIDYIINIGGEDCIGIGCDFDGINCMPENIYGVESLEFIINEVEKKYGFLVAEKFAGKNFLRVMKDVLK